MLQSAMYCTRNLPSVTLTTMYYRLFDHVRVRMAWTGNLVSKFTGAVTRCLYHNFITLSGICTAPRESCVLCSTQALFEYMYIFCISTQNKPKLQLDRVSQRLQHGHYMYPSRLNTCHVILHHLFLRNVLCSRVSDTNPAQT